MIEVRVDPGSAPDPPLPLLEAAARVALETGDVDEADLSVALLDDAAIGVLNRDHLGREGSTDVIAFALWEEGEPVVGDVYVGWEQARRQADEVGVPLAEELARLTVHGTLHVLGWDHPEEADERPGSEMYRLQEELVARVTAG